MPAALLAFRKGEVDRLLVRGKWYLSGPRKNGIEDVLGIDFGVVDLAYDADVIAAPTSNVSAEILPSLCRPATSWQ
jgi:hypothetical protein